MPITPNSFYEFIHKSKLCSRASRMPLSSASVFVDYLNWFETQRNLTECQMEFLAELRGLVKIDFREIERETAEKTPKKESDSSSYFLPGRDVPSPPPTQLSDRDKILQAIDDGKHLMRSICGATGIDGEKVIEELENMENSEIEFAFAGQTRCYFRFGQVPAGRLILDGTGGVRAAEESGKDGAANNLEPSEYALQILNKPGVQNAAKADDVQLATAEFKPAATEISEPLSITLIEPSGVTVDPRFENTIKSLKENGRSRESIEKVEAELQQIGAKPDEAVQSIEKFEFESEDERELKTVELAHTSPQAFAFYNEFPPSAPEQTREIELKKGALALSADVNIFDLNKRERDFYCRLMELVEGFEEGADDAQETR